MTSVTSHLALLLPVAYWYFITTCIDAFAFLTLSQARWGLSTDDTRQEVGSSTGIRYFNNFEEYLTILETGLQQRRRVSSTSSSSGMRKYSPILTRVWWQAGKMMRAAAWKRRWTLWQLIRKRMRNKCKARTEWEGQLGRRLYIIIPAVR